jgi:uncharacterized membrane protein YphA (DoxX/SURF4 family)
MRIIGNDRPTQCLCTWAPELRALQCHPIGTATARAREMRATAQGLLPVTNGGEPAVLFCFIFLYLMFAGAGPWSIDAVLSK